MTISAITRRAVIDELLGVDWFGRLTAVEFLSRLYNLDSLPSTDRRYSTATEDITLHTITFPNDWEPDWVFTDARFKLFTDDNEFLRFLVAMLHPEVRPNPDAARALAKTLNKQLVHDGYELVEAGSISGRPTWDAQPLNVPSVATTFDGADELNSAYVARQLARINEALRNEPDVAIGTAKEWLETVCKTVLAGLGQPVPDDLPKLVRAALDAMPIDVSGASEPDRAEKGLARLIGSLSGLGAAVAEVRNACGTGHGKHASTQAMDPIYGRIVVDATATLVNYLAARFRAAKGK